ncbi:MAG: glycerol kinase GlpK [Candidatus Poribacteria bacterium]|nr:glycerol kinase GlpK [Candidatus Poribacteria bacterium]MDE0504710.1 glycerol kinase GlpK [Candidatus Poribacteria bacterium]
MARKSSPPYVLSIDQGTTGTTALLVDAQGNIAARGYKELRQDYPRPGWVEQDPLEIWETVLHVIHDVIDSGGEPRGINAIGIANQRETTILWDRDTGEPIHPAIVWQCRRTADECDGVKERGLDDVIHAKTGLLVDPYFSATKIAWVIDRVAGAREHAKRGNLAFGTVDTWLLWKLTGGAVHATDYTNASRTLLYDIDNLVWDDELLDVFRIPSHLLPDVGPSGQVFGLVKDLHPALNGLPIAAIAGDQQAALFGQLCVKPGMAKNTYGTGCFLMLNTGEDRVDSDAGLVTTLACNLADRPVYALEGSVFVAGAAVQWLRDGIEIISSSAETESIAHGVNDTEGVVVVPAFTGLGAPYWKADAKGAIIGLTRGVTRAHIVRATLESIAFQTADLVEAMTSVFFMGRTRLRVDGGAAANDFLMQFQADILDMDVERPQQIESTGLGAAFLAGLTCGLWSSISELESCRKVDRVFSPSMKSAERHEKLDAWKDAVRKVMI